MTGQAELRRSLWQRIKGVVIQDVPEPDELCEFECPHLECTASKWRTCDNRLRDLWVNSQSQLHQTAVTKQGPLFKRIAGLWPYLLIATSIVGFAYAFWAAK